jgi:hypothetical protein
VPIKVAQTSDQNPQKDRTEDDQEERDGDSWNFEPLVILHGQKGEAKGDGVLILNAKKEKD